MKLNKHLLYQYFPFFLIAYILLGILSFFYLDRATAYFFLNLDVSPFLTSLVHCVNNLALGWLYIIGLPILVAIAWRLKKITLMRQLIFLFLCVLFSGICVDILKVLLGRARPHELFEYGRYGFYGWQWTASYWSFPSGHTTVIASFMAGLCYLIPKKAIVFIALALFISSMRLILDAHFLSDLMAAYLLAFICVYYLHAFYQKKGYPL